MTISADPARADLMYAFGASAGILTVIGNSATLNTATVPAATSEITVLCSAVDSSGNTVKATTTVTVPPPKEAPPPPWDLPQPKIDLAPMTLEKLTVTGPQATEGYKFSAAVAPTLSWTTGTQTQTISGGNMVLSAVHSSSYCDAGLRQFGLAASASDTGTTKLGASTINVDNNDVKLNFTSGLPGYTDPNDAQEKTRSYVSAVADFMDNNSLGVGLQQVYVADYRFYLNKCSDAQAAGKTRVFSSVGIGAGYMDQRLYATTNTLKAAVLPLSAQVSFLVGQKSGIPPKLIVYGLAGYMPVLTDLHAYQVSGTAGLQIPTKIPWLTVNLTETDLYMNNAPTGFKRNYQNGSVALTFTFPAPPAKQSNPALPPGAGGACYAADKIARVYCYDEVTADACAPPNLFRAGEVCATVGGQSPAFIEKIKKQKKKNKK